MYKLIRKILALFNINIRRSPIPGIVIFNYNFFKDPLASYPQRRSEHALAYALTLNPKTVLDVGSGGGEFADIFRKKGADVTCIDYGTSIYASTRPKNDINLIKVDFNAYKPTQQYDLVWASHVLEHQRNVGIFIERLIDCCAPSGMVIITVPDIHRELWGGHLSIWSPGLLAYNLVVSGVDLSDSKFIRGTNEFSILFKPIKTKLPENLTFDNGDLIKLKNYLPKNLGENIDQWLGW